ERVFDGQHAGEDRSVAMNIFDLAGVDLLIPVEGAAADRFDFALDKPHFALLRPQPHEVAVGKTDLEMRAASRDDVGWRHRLARERPKARRNWTCGERRLCRR